MTISKLDHYSVRTADVDGTRRFYEETLGLKDGPRPPFPFPGAWLYCGDSPVVHVIGVDAKDAGGLQSYLGERGPSAGGTGAVDHIAFVGTDFAGMRERFRALEVPFRERKVPALDLDQLFVTDPNGVTIELNFPARA